MSIESVGTDPPHSCVAFTWHFVLRAQPRGVKSPWGLSPKEIRAHVFFIYLFFSHFLATPLGM